MFFEETHKNSCCLLGSFRVPNNAFLFQLVILASDPPFFCRNLGFGGGTILWPVYFGGH